MDYMPDGTKRLKRIRDFNRKAADIAAGVGSECGYDVERSHPESDKLMEDELIALGYEVGVKTIRASERWYS